MEYEQVEVNPEDVVKEVVAIHQSTAREKGLNLVLDIAAAPDVVLCDPTRLRQALNNLLNNALKFTEKGSVTLKVALRGECAEFSVADTGPGIPSELHDAIFEKFRQGGAFVTRTHGGSGLGLALVKVLVSGMNGTVSLVLEPGKGACFSLTLPLGRKKKNDKTVVSSADV